MAQFKFDKYDHEELTLAGAAFVAHAQGLAPAGTRAWTGEVLGWFERAHGTGTTVYPRRAKGRVVPGLGEFLVDQCHLTEPPFSPNEDVVEWYGRAHQIEMKLALESEWGESRSENESLVFVLDDASKLAAVRARAKVLILATKDGSDFDRFFGAAAQLRGAWDDEAPWLIVDLPWQMKGGTWCTKHCVLPPPR